MIDENVEFLEEYKRLDNLIKDSLGSSEGVSEYIRSMEIKGIVYKYNEFYGALKHLRWIRNELAHKPETMRQDMCELKDIESIDEIYNDILNMNDPITIDLRLSKEKENRNKNIKQDSNKETKLIMLIAMLVIAALSIYFLIYKL